MMKPIYVTKPALPPLEEFIPYLSSASPSNLPVASKAASEVICLPIYPALTIEQVDSVVGIIAG